MIEIKDNQIYFYNLYKRDIIPVSFECMSAYVCQHCKKVLAAYYAGVIPDIEPFLEESSLKYHYTLGTSDGGQYLLLDNHHHKKGCPGWEMISLSARGVKPQIDVWAKRYEVGPGSLQKLCEIITAGKVPGFEIIQDICGIDTPIVLYNEHAFINMNEPGFGESTTRANNLSAYVDWVVGENRAVPFVAPKKATMERCNSCGEHYDTEEQPDKEDHRCGVCIARSTMFSWKCEKCGASFNGPDMTGDKDKILCDACKSQKSEQPEVEEMEVISRYTRVEAIEDGVLIDVTETAKEAGIVYPTAVTVGLWADYIEPPEELKGFQDLQGRLWDVLMMFNYAARTSKSSGSGPQTLYFKTIFQMPTQTGHPKMETVELKAICGPGDTAAPVVTIMKTNED